MQAQQQAVLKQLDIHGKFCYLIITSARVGLFLQQFLSRISKRI